jgi:hypothetical protein
MCGIGRKDAGFGDEIQRIRHEAKPRVLKQLGDATLRQNPLRNYGHAAKVRGIGNKREPTSNIVSILRAEMMRSISAR